MGVDVQPALRVKQSTGDLDGMKGAQQRSFEGTAPRVCCSVRIDCCQSFFKRLNRATDDGGQRRHISGRLHSTRSLRSHKVWKVLRKVQQWVVEDIPSMALRLIQNLNSSLGVALGFIVKTFTLRIDLHAAFHHERP